MTSGSAAVKGKKCGTPNYKDDMLLEAILTASSEQWKTVASRYQIISGESTVRNHYYKRQTNLNNKSVPTAIVAWAQEIQRKILTNEATMNFGGDNENDEEGDDDDDAPSTSFSLSPPKFILASLVSIYRWISWARATIAVGADLLFKPRLQFLQSLAM